MNLIVLYDSQFEDDAKSLSEKLNIEYTDNVKKANEADLILHISENGISLEKDNLCVYADFTNMQRRLKTANLREEMLVKAAKIKDFGDSPIAIDATAGLGDDSLLLAAAGFNVKLFERNPVIAVLLGDAIRRGLENPELHDIVSRMELYCEDSISWLTDNDIKADIILLDPMFPERQKSALIKKKFQLLQKLEMPCTDETELLEAARKICPHKIIIKRPLKGPYLADIKPSYSLAGKAIRYDCIVLINK